MEPEITAEDTHGSMFVDTVGLTGLACGFFGDIDLFESCLQSFPRIPFHLAEACHSFSPLLVQFPVSKKRTLSLLLL